MWLSLSLLLSTPADAALCAGAASDVLVADLATVAWSQGGGGEPAPPPPLLPTQDTVPVAAATAAPAPEPPADDMAWFRAVERSERSSATHMSFLDRGLDSSRWAKDVRAIASRLASRPSGASGFRATDPHMPRTGELPLAVADVPWLHEDITQASIAVMTWSPSGEVHARWYGRDDRVQEQYWSATKHLQALTAATRIGDADLGELSVRDQDGDELVSVQDLLQDIVSYDAGVDRSNGGAKTLSTFTSPELREGLVEAWTGGDVTFRGGYGFGPIVAEPELVDADGELVAKAVPGRWSSGGNGLTAYDLTRVMAMASYNAQLGSDQQLSGVSQESVDSVLEAMGEDSARYVDAALERAGLADQVSDVVIASKLGHGHRSATGMAETTYTGVVQFTDTATGQRHAAVFTFRGVHADPVELDARLAAETTDMVRRLVKGDL